MVVSAVFLALAMFALIGGFLFLNSIIVFNTTRYMAAAPTMLWRDSEFVRQFPNLLKRLYDAGLPSPWPARSSALAALQFRRQLHHLLDGALPDARQLIQRHLSLWAFIQLHREDLRHLIRTRQLQRARRILAESPDSDIRRRIVTLITQCMDAELLDQRRSPPPASTDDSIDWLTRMRSFDILLREHGFETCEELAVLDRWDDADDAAILHELSAGQPLLPALLE